MDLGKAEASSIGAEIKVVAVAIGIAIAALILVAFLLPVGLLLFFGEWLFGSLGWGVLHGVELLVLLATAALLGALRVGRIGRSLLLAFVAGTVVAILLGTNAPNMLYRLVADAFRQGSDPGLPAFGIGAGIGAALGAVVGVILGGRGGSAGGAVWGLLGGAILGAILGLAGDGIWRLAEDAGSRPMVVGLLAIGGLLGLAGLAFGARSGGAGGAVAGLVLGFIAGAAVGAFSAITFPWHVAIAIGIAVFLGLATALTAADAARGLDTEALKARFYPQATIDTTKETIEWAKSRIPGAKA